MAISFMVPAFRVVAYILGGAAVHAIPVKLIQTESDLSSIKLALPAPWKDRPNSAILSYFLGR